ncbi:hypothetical protein KW796_02835 [Candidatus Parcubacteria bacterium]|nr:hypothetical protein [Candidatus Parcubacteria bacterium]
MTSSDAVVSSQVTLERFANSPSSWKEWLEEFEHEWAGDGRWFVAESMLFFLLNHPEIYREAPVEIFKYLLHLADIRTYREGDGHINVRFKLIDLLATRFFGEEGIEPDRVSHRLMRNPEMHKMVWSFLSQRKNIPAGENRPSRQDAVDYIARMYYWTVQWQKQERRGFLHEAILASKADVLQTLIHTGQLHLVFHEMDFSEEMIKALKEFAMTATLDHPVQKEPQTLEDVLAFCWSHEKRYRQAAAYALSLSTIARLRRESAEKIRKQTEQQSSR